MQNQSAPGGSRSVGSSAARTQMVAERLVLDFSALPKEVEVRGQTEPTASRFYLNFEPEESAD